MDEQELTIPFDIEAIHENTAKRIAKKVKKAVISAVLRTLEIIIAIFGVILLLPISIVVFFQNTKNDDIGPIFYTQDRIGKNGKIFKMYKFRTMVTNADEILKAMLQDEEIRKEYEKYRKLPNDPRLTKFGKILRKTSLDEFPQFINVLKGEMSLVGPRPYLPEEKEKMGPYYKYIVEHKPGITGVYQIAGVDRVEFLDRLDMDVRYHYAKSFTTDIKIALITLLITLRKKRTYNVGEMIGDTIHYISKCLSLFIKRIIDILGALVGIMTLIPLTVIIWILNKINKEDGPVFYAQERIGKDGKHFKMYKYRSMVVNADEVLEDLLAKDENARKEYNTYKKFKNDPRITKIGEFLRKTSLDEFPQFINVLKGEMSLVGPRAYMPKEKDDMGNSYENIVKCKPGITGLWQVNGRSSVTFENRLIMDLEYIEKYNLGLDIEILFKTISTVLNKEGAA